VGGREGLKGDITCIEGLSLFSPLTSQNPSGIIGLRRKITVFENATSLFSKLDFALEKIWRPEVFRRSLFAMG